MKVYITDTDTYDELITIDSKTGLENTLSFLTAKFAFEDDIRWDPNEFDSPPYFVAEADLAYDKEENCIICTKYNFDFWKKICEEAI